MFFNYNRSNISVILPSSPSWSSLESSMSVCACVNITSVLPKQRQNLRRKVWLKTHYLTNNSTSSSFFVSSCTLSDPKWAISSKSFCENNLTKFSNSLRILRHCVHCSIAIHACSPCPVFFLKHCARKTLATLPLSFWGRWSMLAIRF